MKHPEKLAGIILFVFITGYLINLAIDASPNGESLEETLEILSEMFTVFVAFSIFTMTWHAYANSRDNHSLLLGGAFFIIGLMTLFHLLSYPYMPDFITPNSQEKSLFFFIMARVLLSLSFLASTYIQKDSFPGLINKRVLFYLILILSVISTATGLFNINLITWFFAKGTPKAMLFFFITVVLLFSNHRLLKRFKETGQKSIILFIYGSTVLAFSNIIYFSYEIPAHFMIITGFFYTYLALYRSSIQIPYEKLAIAEECLRSAAQSANDAMISIDTSGKIIFWNNGAQKMFGYRDDEVMEKELIFLMPERYRDFHRGGMARIDPESDPGIIGKTVELHGLKRDGNEFPVELSLSPWKVGGNLFYSGILRDITERKRIEEINIENERLIYANKAKSDFLTIMSHELRTPLNSIIGFSELLKKNKTATLTEKQEHYVDNVLINGRNLLALIDDILDLSYIEAGKIKLNKENMRVRDAINEVINLAGYKSHEKNIILKLEFDPALETIEADTQRFKQIFYNLLSNAVKFSKIEGGIVTVITKKEDNSAYFSVTDTGIGIKDEDFSRLFNTFEQMDSGSCRKFGGTGLGLAISKQLAQLHGGKITVKSKYGEGSTFTLILPIRSQQDDTKKKSLSET